VLRKLIKAFPDAELNTRGDAFQTLARSIIGQQISVRAAQSVWERFVACAGDMTPARVAALAPNPCAPAGFRGRRCST
jgi:DNA-3-methyladenine glycosylase II